MAKASRPHGNPPNGTALREWVEATLLSQRSLERGYFEPEYVRQLVQNHVNYTGSPKAKWILEHWERMLPRFVKVFPHEFQRVLGVAYASAPDQTAYRDYLVRLGIPEEKLNVNVGGIALGHPFGCTGAKLTATLLHELRRRGQRFGIVSMCIGGGMGGAGLFEVF